MSANNYYYSPFSPENQVVGVDILQNIKNFLLGSGKHCFYRDFEHKFFGFGSEIKKAA